MKEVPIFVNARFLTQQLTGVQRYAIEISLQIKKHYPDVEFVAPKGIRHRHIAQQLNVKQIGRFRGVLWEQMELPRYVGKSGGVLLSLCNTAPLAYSKNALVVHDLAFHFAPKSMHILFRTWYRFLLPKLIYRSLYLFVVSKTVRNEIKQVFQTDRKIELAYNGIFIQANYPGLSFASPGPYILHVGSFNSRKKITNLVRAFLADARLYLNYKLVFIGANSNRLIKDMPISHSAIIIQTGCSDEELIEWYRNASCLVSLSTYEGFNLPIAEALFMGCRVVCSDIPVHRELFDNRAYFCDPNAISGIASTLVGCLHQPVKPVAPEWPEMLSYFKSAHKIISTIRQNEN